LRLEGLRQCVHLPSPGIYQLTGFGQTTFAPAVQRDSVILMWQLRLDGNEQCDVGPVDASGDLLLTRLNNWAAPPLPAVIPVAPGAWTSNSSITVTLVMVDAGLSVPAVVQGWFDGISLTVTLFDQDELFADGFE